MGDEAPEIGRCDRLATPAQEQAAKVARIEDAKKRWERDELLEKLERQDFERILAKEPADLAGYKLNELGGRLRGFDSTTLTSGGPISGAPILARPSFGGQSSRALCSPARYSSRALTLQTRTSGTLILAVPISRALPAYALSN